MHRPIARTASFPRTPVGIAIEILDSLSLVEFGERVDLAKLGGEIRQIVAGIAQHYTIDELIGQRIVVVANLEETKIRNESSRGMLLAAKDGESLTLLTTLEEMKSGSKIN